MVDYDFNAQSTGINVIENLGINDQAYLVTGNYDSEDLQRECLEKDIVLIPKSLIEFIPSEIV